MLAGLGLFVAAIGFFGARPRDRGGGSIPPPVRVGGSIAPPTAVPSAAAPAPQPAAHAQEVPLQWDAMGQPIARDPSIDPQALTRAYPKRSQALPAEARPKASAIDPPQREWNRIKRQDRPIVY